jgi:hypothetical protein
MAIQNQALFAVQCSLKALGIVVFLLLFNISMLWAEKSPVQTVEDLMQEMKKTGTAAPALNLYHWPSVYNEMGTEEREVFGANSPDELKAAMQTFFENPESFFSTRMKANMGNLPPEQMAMMDGIIQPMVKSIAGQMQEANARLKETEFTVKEKSNEGDRALVEVSTSHPKTGKDNQDLRLQKIDQKWFLIDTVNAGASPMEGAEPR